MGKENKTRRTDGLDPWRTRSAPVPMQDTAPRATQDSQDQAVKFHGEQRKPRPFAPGEAKRQRQALIDKGIIQPGNGT